MAFSGGKRLAILALGFVAAASGAHAQEWKVNWEETFDGESLDRGRWQVNEGRPRVEGGRLMLDGDTSGTIRLTTRESWLYGRFAVRVRLPGDPKLRATVALVPEDGESDAAVASLFQWSDGEVRSGIEYHYGPETMGHREPLPGFEDGALHLIELDWSEGLFAWRVDGQPARSETQWYALDRLYPAPFDRPARLRIMVMGQGPGAALTVGSVRVYERTGPPPQKPFCDPLPSIPGTIEAEEFDRGGQGVGYLDCTGVNEGGVLRPDEGVDIERCTDIGDGHHVAYTMQGEWLEYTVQVRRTGLYRVDARVSSLDAGGGLAVRLHGGDHATGTGPAFFPPTGDWKRWVTTPVGTIRLEQGRQVLRVEILRPFFNLNRLELTRVEQPVGAPKPWMLF